MQRAAFANGNTSRVQSRWKMVDDSHVQDFTAADAWHYSDDDLPNGPRIEAVFPYVDGEPHITLHFDIEMDGRESLELTLIALGDGATRKLSLARLAFDVLHPITKVTWRAMSYDCTIPPPLPEVMLYGF